VKISERHAQSFTHPGAGVVEKEQQCIVADAKFGLLRGLSQEDFDLFGFEIGADRILGFLGSDRQDADILLGVGGIVAQCVLEEGPKGHQPAVSGTSAVASSSFQLVEEAQNGVDLEVLDVESLDGTMEPLAHVVQKQAKRIPIGVNCVGARTSDLAQIVEEEPLQQVRKQWGIHECPRRNRAAMRLLASANKSGEAFK
jgi:hypothetical protein